ncbi:conserved hypothetical protein [Frankia canadensis]|uniref:Uncharacterized protein n=1 Tax=Frankia canadensis TaxID=1836972 RepID=A0A2I2KT33_9ACTN|nr:hypothetical protein [Frankia canadensis]SNQ48806.1 conserved hypothetical protein [Frankia canadensis]SOU56096.1 conserved hypothetical protein [Frankia canadensis]
MRVDLGDDRGRRRIDRSAAAVAQARQDVAGWLGARSGDPRFARFDNHLTVLGTVLGRMLDALAGRLDDLRTAAGVGAAYDGCRAVDTVLTVVRRTFDWYRERYDQRLDERLGPVLLAADEVVRSCWAPPFAALGRPAPTGPLAYVDPRFNAFALTRAAVPSQLRPPARTDAVGDAVRALLGELPIPTIALPEWSTREAWWLALAAHETGHHLQRDLAPDLAERTREALAAAVGGPGAAAGLPGERAELAGQWVAWQAELFADAFAAVMVADAAVWTVDELEHGGSARLAGGARPGSPYPPALVRRALLAELTRRVRGGPAEPFEGGAEEVRRHLAVVPAVAAALLALPVGGTTLLGLGRVDPGWYAARGRVASWAAALRRDPVPITSPARRTPPAARLAVQAGIAAATTVAPAALADVHRRLVELLRGCGPDGVLAAPPIPPGDLAAVADRLTGRLLGDPLLQELPESAVDGAPDLAAVAPCPPP